MLTKLFLGASGAIFTVYGGACFLDPTLAANYAGMTLTNADAHLEMRAMYGGVQIAFGLFALQSLMRGAQWQQAAIMMGVLLFAGLVLGRVVGLALGEGPTGVYTHGALIYELISLAVGVLALRASTKV